MYSFYRYAVCVGGYFGTIYTHLEVYSFQSNIWTAYGSGQTGLNDKLLRVGQFVYEGKLYFLGGDYMPTETTNIYLFNPENVTATLVGALRQPMSGAVTILFNV